MGGIGDGGILTTSSKKIRDRLLALRNYGSVTKYEHPIIGYNNRLDTIQAAFLNEKIKFIRQYNDARVNIAKIYHNTINHKDVVNFQNAHYCDKNTYHVYPIRTANRCAMAKHLLRNGVETAIHYPTPVEETGAFSKKFSESHNKKTRIFSRNVLSLPIHPFMTESQAMHVVSVINSF